MIVELAPIHISAVAMIPTVALDRALLLVVHTVVHLVPRHLIPARRSTQVCLEGRQLIARKLLPPPPPRGSIAKGRRRASLPVVCRDEPAGELSPAIDRRSGLPISDAPVIINKMPVGLHGTI